MDAKIYMQDNFPTPFFFSEHKFEIRIEIRWYWSYFEIASSTILAQSTFFIKTSLSTQSGLIIDNKRRGIQVSFIAPQCTLVCFTTFNLKNDKWFVFQNRQLKHTSNFGNSKTYQEMNTSSGLELCTYNFFFDDTSSIILCKATLVLSFYSKWEPLKACACSVSLFNSKTGMTLLNHA